MPGPDDVIKEIDRVTLWTFENIFMQVYWAEEKKEESERGIKTLRDYLHLVSTISSRLEGGKVEVDIWCGHSFLTKDYPEGTPEKDKNDPKLFFDSRPAERGGQTAVRPLSTCGTTFLPDGTEENLFAFTEDITTPTGPIELIVICADMFEHWNTNPIGISGSLQNLRTATLVKRPPLDVLTWNVATLLLHEISHSALMGPGDGTRDHAYRWKNLVKLTGEKALNNADSFAYFIIAMYFDRNNWASGLARALPGDGSGVVDADAED
ncbi:putative Protein kinase [Arthroderma uncinatum]|uniref:putative Protein kinase n=1 Tax=Arthroderma uncinatum TaxID=74035 RepID=UPI00144AB217|nr:putative Protein kinase [Arthroderma uncinatum]KAF3490949.1 putative Protein kinase [Arthroderma uncinatum]